MYSVLAMICLQITSINIFLSVPVPTFASTSLRKQSIDFQVRIDAVEAGTEFLEIVEACTEFLEIVALVAVVIRCRGWGRPRIGKLGRFLTMTKF